jgi:UrcA family protein
MTSHTGSSVLIKRAAAAAFVSMAISATSSFAQARETEADTRTVTVKYADLNLATEDGSRELYNRLVGAARQVCPQADTLLALNQQLQSRRCMSDAVDRAVKDVKNPKLAEVASDSHLR